MRHVPRSFTTALAVLAVLCSAVAAEAQEPPAQGLSFSGEVPSVETPPPDQPLIVFVADPDGYQVELYQPALRVGGQ